MILKRVSPICADCSLHGTHFGLEWAIKIEQ
jgi:hypothetical protein